MCIAGRAGQREAQQEEMDIDGKEEPRKGEEDAEYAEITAQLETSGPCSEFKADTVVARDSARVRNRILLSDSLLTSCLKMWACRSGQAPWSVWASMARLSYCEYGLSSPTEWCAGAMPFDCGIGWQRVACQWT